jgi:hypothetical protein
MRHFRPHLVLILVLVFAAGPLFADGDREVSATRKAPAVEIFASLWQRLTAVFAALGPEMDPGGTSAPSGERGTTPTMPPPTNLGPEADPGG